MIRSALTLMKPTIPPPANIPVKLSINVCAQTKVNGGMLCFTNICLMKVPCQKSDYIVKEEDVPPFPLAKIQRAIPTSQCMEQAMHSELMLKERRSRERRKITFVKHPLPCALSH